jgi:hypothetical protein
MQIDPLPADLGKLDFLLMAGARLLVSKEVPRPSVAGPEEDARS